MIGELLSQFLKIVLNKLLLETVYFNYSYYTYCSSIGKYILTRCVLFADINLFMVRMMSFSSRCSS